MFTVRRPTLIFGPVPKLFYGTFSRKLFKCPIFAFQCSFWCLRDHYFDKNELNVTLQAELQIIFESNAYLRPNFLLNADFQIPKSIFTPCYFSQCWKGRYYCFEVPYLNFFWCNFNYNFGSDLLLLVITIEYILTIFWQYVDKRTDRLTSTIQSLLLF